APSQRYTLCLHDALPIFTTVPITMKGPPAHSNLSSWYKNRKYQSGMGIKLVLFGSARSPRGGSSAITSVMNPTRTTTATIHSFNRKLGKNGSVLPGNSE